VEWFNSVDATYRADLRELNELNFARFDAKLEQRLAELRAELRHEVRQEIQGLHGQLREFKADLIKWTFVFVTGGTLTVLSVLIGVLKLTAGS
jgi:hypothetical protein